MLFHPNSNYIATGSSDRTVRLWDCLSGNYVRLMTGHKAPIYSLAFAMCGRFLASGSADHRVLIWDLAHGHLIAQFCGHTGTIHSLCFSRDGTILATGMCNMGGRKTDVHTAEWDLQGFETVSRVVFILARVLLSKMAKRE